ncbi:MAG: FixH family protein [Paludibacterium sp.]|uniref:FixH family protein n=1 Tax=Paludibacterium sp. TaxID=1917523 RepID=UPI0025D49BC6|nr:FixH family protein [Paludibacterium sp.]MBV8047950.1 FixH family protein [Paludibacterium sp.]MBV8647227.1 FixH family protein [Paludibacterium sp.]
MKNTIQAQHTTPWYRQRWPWLLMSIPFASICVGSYFAYIATHGADPMVQEQYYAAGQAINSVIDAGKAAQQMGLSGQLTLQGTSVSLTLTARGAEPLPPVLTLQLSHPTIATLDQTLTLVAGSPGHYSGELKPTSATRWDLTLTPQDKRWSLSGEWNRDEGSQTALTPTDMREAQN